MKSDLRPDDSHSIVFLGGGVSVCSFLQGRRGDLLVSLCYNPTANTITVNIIKARHLKAMDIGGTSGKIFALFVPVLNLFFSLAPLP